MRGAHVAILTTCMLAAAASALVFSSDKHRDSAADEARELAQKQEDRIKRGIRPSAIASRARFASAEREAHRWRHLMPGPRKVFGALAAESWINLGPTEAFTQFHGQLFDQVDAGRANDVAVDPRDPNVVYLATAGGGLWKTWDFIDAAPNPTWHPIGDALPNLAIGSVAIAASAPDTILLGLGDPFGIEGNAILTSHDGGGTWEPPAALNGTYAGGLEVTALSVRSMAIDPEDARTIFAAADVGLFASRDGGTSFTLIDLPNADAPARGEAMWSVAYLGRSGVETAWIASGVAACDAGWLPPWPVFGVLEGQFSAMRGSGEVCPRGNLGDIWRSVDSGRSWTSIRGQRGFASIPAGELGPIIMSVSTAGNPDRSVVYALLGAADEGQSVTQGIWRSDNGGVVFADATGVLTNPTLGSDCPNMGIASFQAWYDLAIAVDPNNAEHVIAGGGGCMVRTLNGRAANPSWQNVMSWFPPGDQGLTEDGLLPYVHADFHRLNVVPVQGRAMVFAGNDGGLFTSGDVLTTIAPTQVHWSAHNRGLATHLIYGVGSGDPADGSQGVVLAGLQDNGTLFRTSAHAPNTFTQVIGGDGFEAAVGKGTSGEVYLASLYNAHFICLPRQADCSLDDSWVFFDPPLSGDDAFPFYTSIAPIQTDPTGTGFLTNSNQHIFRTDMTDLDNPRWTQIATFAEVHRVFASQTVGGLYGAVVGRQSFGVTSDAGATWTASERLGALGVVVGRGSSIAFPASIPAGKHAGDVYVAASEAWTLELDRDVLVPPDVGHLFLTEDRGRTFTPLHGNGTGSDLPEVPIHIVRYDPADFTNQTIYAGTNLGAYVTRDGGATWQRLGHGLPLVEVTDMYIAKNSSLMRISTFGRGVWELYLSNEAQIGVRGDGDFDRNGIIDWRDLAALTSRLGTTPATGPAGGWPAYSWIDDLVYGTAGQPANAIDDGDLNALLSRFGDHP